MPEPSQPQSDVQSALRRVARRQHLRAFGAAAFRWTVALVIACAVYLFGARLSLWPDAAPSLLLWSIPAVALLLAWPTYKRPKPDLAARAADQHLATDDLFLTSTAGGRGIADDYGELVQASAARQAARLRPSEIAPLPFVPRLTIAALALLGLWVAHAFVPSFDPFGSGAERTLLAQQAQKLASEHKAVTERKKALVGPALEQRNSQKVGRALEEAVRSFQKLDRRAQDKNRERLKSQAAKLGAEWRAAKEKSPLSAGASASLQRLGDLATQQRQAAWERELSDGKVDSLRSELKQLHAMLQELAKSGNPEAADKLRRELQRRTKGLKDFLDSHAASQPLNETLSKMLNQLQALGVDKLAEKAKDALRESFELSDMELKALAQSMRDLKDLEAALRALQAARKANEKGGCDCPGGGGEGKGKGKKPGPGEDQGGPDGASLAKTLEQYREFYERMLAQQDGEGPGPGMKGEGKGEGGIAPEDPSQKNKFKTEKSRSALVAGKMLMSLKTREEGDRGKVTGTYSENLQRVKQGVSEAILQERVPPGYHDGIRKYFDDLGQNAPPTGTGDTKKK